MTARQKVHQLMHLHEGNIQSCFVTATQVYKELKQNGIKNNFWYKVIKEIEKWKKNLEK